MVDVVALDETMVRARQHSLSRFHSLASSISEIQFNRLKKREFKYSIENSWRIPAKTK